MSSGEIGSILVSPDGKLIHTGNRALKAKISTWDAASGFLIRRFGIFRLGNTDALLSPDGKIIGYGFGGMRGDRLVLFDSATGKEKLQIKKSAYHFALNNEVVAMSTKDDVRFFSTKDGRYLYELQHRVREFSPSRPEFSPDSKLVLWLGSSRSIHQYEDYANRSYNDEIVWFDWKKRRMIHAIEFPQINLLRARFSGDGKVILAIGLRHYWQKGPARNKKVEGTANLFAVDVGTGKQLYTKSIGRWSKDFAVSPNGRWFAFFNHASVDNVGSLSIYEVRSGKEVHQVLDASARMSPRSPRMSPRATCWSPDSQTLYIEHGIVKRLRLQRDGSWREIDQN